MSQPTSYKLPLARTAFASGILLSSIAAWYSITGLATLFSGAFWPVVIMGGALEIGKLVAASWVYRNWDHAPFLLKSYLTTAVVILMFVTAIGIFGFLSKAHLTQSVDAQLAQNQVAIYDVQLDGAKGQAAAAKAALNKINKTAEKFLDSSTDQAGLDKALEVQRLQRRERQRALADLIQANKDIQRLETERAPHAVLALKTEAEVGPIKYVAEALYGHAEPTALGKAVRWLISAIVCVFDPLAVLLIIAANTEAPNRDTKGRFLPKEPKRVLWQPPIKEKQPKRIDKNMIDLL